jgi:hypothetical protein
MTISGKLTNFLESADSILSNENMELTYYIGGLYIDVIHYIVKGRRASAHLHQTSNNTAFGTS